MDLIQASQQQRVVQNVVQNLRDRNYFVPVKYKIFEDLTASEFKHQFVNKTLYDPFVLNSFSLVVSKFSDNVLSEALKEHTELMQLPDITKVIGKVIETKTVFERWYRKIMKGAGDEEAEDASMEEAFHLSQEFDDETKRAYLKMGDLKLPVFREDEILVLFVRKLNNAVGIEGMDQLLKYQDLLQCKKMILVLQNESNWKKVITRDSVRALRLMRNPTEENNYASVEWFQWVSRTYNPSATRFHGRFERYTESRRDDWLAVHNLTLEQLETILAEDPMTEYYDFAVNDLIQIHESDGNCRFVSIGTQK